jgi:hypothetical protein
MGVKDVTKFHGATVEHLGKLTTVHLLAILESSRKTITCGCRYHCGDDVLEPDQREYNKNQYTLNENIHTVLAIRPHVESRKSRSEKPVAKKQKKVMQY